MNKHASVYTIVTHGIKLMYKICCYDLQWIKREKNDFIHEDDTVGKKKG